jgi:hypothetical protein
MQHNWQNSQIPWLETRIFANNLLCRALLTKEGRKIKWSLFDEKP